MENAKSNFLSQKSHTRSMLNAEWWWNPTSATTMKFHFFLGESGEKWTGLLSLKQSVVMRRWKKLIKTQKNITSTSLILRIIIIQWWLYYYHTPFGGFLFSTSCVTYYYSISSSWLLLRSHITYIFTLLLVHLFIHEEKTSHCMKIRDDDGYLVPSIFVKLFYMPSEQVTSHFPISQNDMSHDLCVSK